MATVSTPLGPMNAILSNSNNEESKSNSASNNKSQEPKTQGNVGGDGLVYPDDLKGSQNSPFIKFKQVDKDVTIFLPMPPNGVSFNDGANYGTVDLGLIGPVYKQITDEDGEVPDYDESQQATMSSLPAAISTLVKKSGPENVQSAISLGTGKVEAKNTHVVFQSNNLRQFNFVFKMVAYNQDESNTIKSIIDAYRFSVYAELESNGIVVKFPKPWIIQFYHENGKLNKYLPYIKQSYLTSLTANYNGSTNLYHKDGAPVEVDVTLQFQETKVLHKQDLRVSLEDGYKYFEQSGGSNNEQQN